MSVVFLCCIILHVAAALLSVVFSWQLTETVCKTGLIMVLGEISSTAKVDYQRVLRDTIKYIGYDDSAKGTFLHG